MQTKMVKAWQITTILVKRAPVLIEKNNANNPIYSLKIEKDIQYIDIRC